MARGIAPNFLCASSPFDYVGEMTILRTLIARASWLTVTSAALSATWGCGGAPEPASEATPVLTPKEREMQAQFDNCDRGYDLTPEKRIEACLAVAPALLESGNAEMSTKAYLAGCLQKSAESCVKAADAYAAGVGAAKVENGGMSLYQTACDLGRKDACDKLPAGEGSETEREYRLFTQQLAELEHTKPESILGASKGTLGQEKVYACTKELQGFETDIIGGSKGGSYRIRATANREKPLPPDFDRVLEEQTKAHVMLRYTMGDSQTSPTLAKTLATLNTPALPLVRIVALVKDNGASLMFFRGVGTYYELAIQPAGR